ncbi:MAG: thioredoxin domain-containing protein [Puniceicoccaceae bacterium]|nr:MAG: thioredoxin domain-containing protein [Puniceicoccaceae bacterium]
MAKSPQSSTPGGNRLAGAPSPYLRQHADNPVEWHPWGEEALRQAHEQDRPIFLSVGYSTCHWCHVMARESFADPEIAALLNEGFVNIKVDREERPDVDRLFMTYLLAATGSGGWPMSVWLTPDLKPFYAGTYFPPEDRPGRPGFATVLRALRQAWEEERDKIEQQGIQSMDALRDYAGRDLNDRGPLEDPEVVDRAMALFGEAFDREHGGFGSAPKFPRPAALRLLQRVAREGGDEERSRRADRMVRTTLVAMAGGGIHDQLGGGFHRYSVDRFWRVPHFEKMLYDQAQLAEVYLEDWRRCGAPELRQALEGIFDYVLGELHEQEGAFYSAEDADSPVPGEGGHAVAEGAFYLWTVEEVREALSEEKAALVEAVYGLRPEGNAPPEADPLGELAAKNVLHQARSVDTAAAQVALSPEQAGTLLEQAKAKLLERRNARPRPQRDDKIIAAWNGLMLSALVRAGVHLPAPRLLEEAKRAAWRLRELLWQPGESRLLRLPAVAGSPPVPGFAEDYAALARGLLDLYEATFAIDALAWALELAEALLVRFADPAKGGFFDAEGGGGSLPLRMKEDHDGAEPAASSLAAEVCLRLGRMLGRTDLLKAADHALAALSRQWRQRPDALPAMVAVALDRRRAECQVVVHGDPASEAFQALATEARSHLPPGAVLLAADGGCGQAWLAERVPALRDLGPPPERAEARVCRDFACHLPVDTPENLRAQLPQLPD